MNILLYNFVQYDEKGNPGGGVTVYLKNLVNELLSQGHKVIFLSSGDRYDFFNRDPYIKFFEDKGVLRCIIYNSPFIAPSASSFHQPNVFVDDNRLNDLTRILYERLPDIDVFHFHNIEGLTSRFLIELRNIYKQSKFIYSVHNYNLLCMQVNLWKNNKKNCISYEDGKGCVNCVEYRDIHKHEANIKYLNSILKKIVDESSFLGKLIYKIAKIIYHKYRYVYNSKNLKKYKDICIDRDVDDQSIKFKMFRENNIKLMSVYFDYIISVSNRTDNILKKFGFEKNNMSVEYIGTKFSSAFKDAVLKDKYLDNLTIGYLGYMRSDKGFDFFLESLKEMPLEISKKINVIIAAKYRDKLTLDNINSLKYKFNCIKLYNGYNHENIKEILEFIDLGIIPVQWEDNLPQVAIEFVANGIPILCSDLGGPSEIYSKDPKFTFIHDDKLDFYSKINFLVENPNALSLFWENDIKIFSMREHSKQLVDFYYS
ncbi:glycosyltransferase [Acinetobacter variabilis]|uniref:glycosyltransferase n=1 Tax=Acinetobacter variabilis TaxID=70346 RepID=UPI00289F5938|nr:glycosyltransferase [Acinetobacter variabilis]